MKISEIHIQNFKSFEDATLKLKDFNVIVGPNASGKSNLLSVFTFITQIADDGLENAIYMQGGKKYLRNLFLSDEPCIIEISQDSEPEDNLKSNIMFRHYTADKVSIKYQMKLDFYKKGNQYKLPEEKIEFSGTFLLDPEAKSRNDEPPQLNVTYEVISKGGKIHQYFESNPVSSRFARYYEENLPSHKKGESILNNPYIQVMFPIYLSSFVGEVDFYNIDPKTARKGVSLSGKAKLASNGENIALRLKEILKSQKNKTRFMRLLKDILPFSTNLTIRELTYDSYIFHLEESLLKSSIDLPSSFLSDGTIDLIAYIIALYFEKSSRILIFEEPERNLHPALISKLVTMMREVSKKKQILATTHNIQFITHTYLEDLVFVYRNDKGFSTLIRPENSETVKYFLNEQFGVDELFLNNFFLVG